MSKVLSGYKGLMYYRRDGTAHSDMQEWATMFEKGDRIVQQSYLPNGIFVSTVFLGLDHSFGDGPPLIFESMAFSASENVHKAGAFFTTDFTYHEELDCARYSTEAEAAVGHVMMCLRWYPDTTRLLPEVAHGSQTSQETTL